MTTPEIQTVKSGGSRYYVSPLDNKRKVPGVTSVLGMLPQPWMGPWVAKVIAEEAVDNLPGWIGMVLNGRGEEAKKYLKQSRFKPRDKAADFGTAAHGVWELMAEGKPVPKQHPDMQPFITGFQQFMDQFEPEFLHLERTVWNEEHGYAGSFDWIARFPGEKLGHPEVEFMTCIGDNKTTKSGVHEDVALQLNAYANGDGMLNMDGTLEDLPQIDGALVFHCRPEGWQLVPVRMGDDLLELFVSLMKVHEWDKVTKKTVVAQPVGSGSFS